MSDVDLSSIKAGEYELVALRWDEITSKPGEPFDFVRHRKGDKVTLDVEQARRLVVAGAVVKPGAESDELPGTGPSVAPGANDPAAKVLPGTDVTPPGDEPVGEPVGEVEPPARSAPKADWEAFARAQGANEEDLEGQTKDDLVSAYGS